MNPTMINIVAKIAGLTTKILVATVLTAIVKEITEEPKKKK